MSIRESIEQHRGLAAGITGVFIVVAIGMTVYGSRSGDPGPNTRTYYTDDDGKTYFADDINKLYPFDHNGKQAYLANVFESSKGGRFVAYLSRINDAARPKLEAMKATPGGVGSDDYVRALNAAVEIRRPGDTTWARQGSPAFAKVAEFPCPDGGTDPHSVSP
jgi:hypothetical protein